MNHDMYQQFSVRRASQWQRHPVPTVINSSSSVPDTLHREPWHTMFRAAAPHEAGYFGHQSSYQSLDFTGGMPGLVNLTGQHVDRQQECPAVTNSSLHGFSATGQQHSSGYEMQNSRKLQQLAMWRMQQASSSYGLGLPSGELSSGVYPAGYVPTTGAGGVAGYVPTTGAGGIAGYVPTTGAGGIEFNMSGVRGINDISASGYAPYNNGMDFSAGLQAQVSGVQPSYGSISAQIPILNQTGGGVMPYCLNSMASGGIVGSVPSSQRSLFGQNGLLPHYGSLTSGINRSFVNDQLMSSMQFAGPEPNGFSHMPHGSLYQISSYPSASVADVHPSAPNVDLSSYEGVLRTRIIGNVDSRQMNVQPTTRGTACIPVSYAQLPASVRDPQITVNGIHQWVVGNNGPIASSEGPHTSLLNKIPTTVEKINRNRKRRRPSSFDSEENDVELTHESGLSTSKLDTSLSRQARYELRERNKAIAEAAAIEKADGDLSSTTGVTDDSDQDPTWQDDQSSKFPDEVDRNGRKNMPEKNDSVKINSVKSVTNKVRSDERLLRWRTAIQAVFTSVESDTAEAHCERMLLHENVTQYEDISSTGDQPSLLMECYDDSDDVTNSELSLRERQQVSKPSNVQRAEKTNVTNVAQLATSSSSKTASSSFRVVDVLSGSNIMNNQSAINVGHPRLRQALMGSEDAPLFVPSGPGTLNEQPRIADSRLNQVSTKSGELDADVVSKTSTLPPYFSRRVPNNFMLSQAKLKENSNRAIAGFHLELRFYRSKETAPLERLLGWQPSMGTCSTQKPCSGAAQHTVKEMLANRLLASRATTCYQCAFCPLIEKKAQKVSTHIARRHREMNLGLHQINAEKHIMYLYCRHCDYVGYDQVMMLLHFDSYHSMSLAVTCDNSFCPNPMVADSSRLCPLVKAVVFPFFCCPDCDYMSSNKSHATDHVACEHATRFTNCFVLLIMVAASRDPVCESTYRNRAQHPMYASLRKNIYACVRCDFFSSQPFCTLSHNLLVHRVSCMAFVCDVVSQSCDKRFSSIADARRHLQLVHGSGITGCFQMKVSVTLVNVIKDVVLECFFQPGKIVKDNFPEGSSDQAIEIVDESDEDVVLVLDLSTGRSNENDTDSFARTQVICNTLETRAPVASGSGVSTIESCLNANVPNSAASSITCGRSSSLEDRNATLQSTLVGVTVSALPNRNDSSASQPGVVAGGISSQQNTNTASKDCVIDLCADESESFTSIGGSVSNNPDTNVDSLQTTVDGITSQQNQNTLSKDSLGITSQQNQNTLSKDSLGIRSQQNQNTLSKDSLGITSQQNTVSKNSLVDVCAVNSENVSSDAYLVLDDSNSSVNSELTSQLPASTGNTNRVEEIHRAGNEDFAVTSIAKEVYRDCIWAEVDPFENSHENQSSSAPDSDIGDTGSCAGISKLSGSQNDDQASQDHDKPSQEHDKASQYGDQASQDHDQASQYGDQASQDHDQSSQYDDQASQDHDKASQYGDQASQDHDKASQYDDQASQDHDQAITSHSSHLDTLNFSKDASSMLEEVNPVASVEAVVTTSASRLKRLVSYRFYQTINSTPVDDMEKKSCSIVEPNSIFSAEELSQLNDLP